MHADHEEGLSSQSHVPYKALMLAQKGSQQSTSTQCGGALSCLNKAEGVYATAEYSTE